MDYERMLIGLRTLANRHCGTLHTTCKEGADAIAALRAEVELAQSESRKARKRVAELAAEVERLREAVLAAYRKGHHHTVNGGYQWCDQGGREVVEEIIREAGEEE